MKRLHYGEDQPRLQDDRLPVLMVLLDGLGEGGEGQDKGNGNGRAKVAKEHP